MVPRVLSDLFWFGRYAERAEDLLRLILATRTVAIETDSDTTPGRPLEALLQAVTHVSTTYPGFLQAGRRDDAGVPLDAAGPAPGGHAPPSRSARCRWPRRASATSCPRTSGWCWPTSSGRWPRWPANPYDQGLQLTDASERVLSGLLALAGIASENMVRDPGWYMLDSGRGLERALQVVALLKVTLCRARAPETERLVIEAVLTAAESIVTFRRRYRGRTGVEAVVELLVIDGSNPRSVAYQLQRIRTDLRAMPNTSPTARPLRLLDGLVERVRIADPVALAETVDGRRPALGRFLAGLQQQLRALSEAIRDQYQQAAADPAAAVPVPERGGAR